MTNMTCPEKARVFIVGANQATPFPVNMVQSHADDMDALFHRNGQDCRKLYERVRDGRPSPTRANTDRLRNGLKAHGVTDIVETNVICYARPMRHDLADKKHTGDRA